MQHVFNTGCLYQSHGQVIAAKFINKTQIVFCDYSRMIDGIITSDIHKFALIPASFRTQTFERLIKDKYLRHEYEMICDTATMTAAKELSQVCEEFLASAT
jgi:hypothetical protein